MTFEQRVESALRTADRFQPSPDLFAKVRRSIEEDRAHRTRVRCVFGAAAAAVTVVLMYIFVTVDVADGVWSMSFTALEVLTTLIMVAIVIVLGPAIRRFGETFEQDIFRASPETGRRILQLLDVAYYLIFGAYVLMTMVYKPTRELAHTTLTDWLSFELAATRLPGLLLLMGVLHVALLLALPVVGLIFNANGRRERIMAGVPSVDAGMDKVDTAITVVSWVLAILLVLDVVAALLVVVAGLGASG